MRTTLGTNLARAGVAPQLAQRITRHADYPTTLKHYTVLGLTDTARAIRQLPTIDTPADDAIKATGTANANPHQYPHQRPTSGSAKANGAAQVGATRQRKHAKSATVVTPALTRVLATLRESMLQSATICAGVTQW